MRLLVLASALDLQLRLSSTPHWWQLLRALAVEGADLTVVPYAGRPIESLYWRAAANPCLREGQAFALFRTLALKVRAQKIARQRSGEGIGDRVMRLAAQNWIRPRWTAAVHALFRQESGFDAVVMLNVPLNHLTGLAAEIRARYHVPVWYYDGDLPSSLPEFDALASSFRVYEGADVTEYDGFFSNSVGAVPRLQAMGVKQVEVVHWGADPDVYRQLTREQDLDTFFHGYGEAYRLDALEAMVYEPARREPGRRFALGGAGFYHAPGEVELLGDIAFAHYPQAVARAKVNLIATRASHAEMEGTSSARPFELGALGAAAVTNPWKGIERWFEPGREILVVRDVTEALAAYKELWAHESLRREMGAAMRARVLAEHTYQHRARQILAKLRS